MTIRVIGTTGSSVTQPTPLAGPYEGRTLFSTRGALFQGFVASDVFGAKTAETGKIRHVAPYTGSGLRFYYFNSGAYAITVKVGVSSFKAYFGGSRTITLDPGAGAWTDPVGIPLTAGDVYYEKVYVTVASGEKWYPNVFTLAARNEGTATTDTTDSGSSTEADGFCFGAAAITADFVASGTVTTALAVVGDSIPAGQEDDDNRGPLYGYIARLLDGAVPFVNVAIGGTSGAQWKTGTYQDVRGPFAVLPNVYVAYGTNDAGSGTSGTLETSLQAIYDFYGGKGCRVFGATITPRPSSASNWTTGAGQVVDSAYEARVDPVNTWVRANQALAAYIDVRAAVEDATPGTWKPAYTNGGVHPLAAGMAAIAAHSSAVAFAAALRTVTV